MRTLVVSASLALPMGESPANVVIFSVSLAKLRLWQGRYVIYAD